MATETKPQYTKEQIEEDERRSRRAAEINAAPAPTSPTINVGPETHTPGDAPEKDSAPPAPKPDKGKRRIRSGGGARG